MRRFVRVWALLASCTFPMLAAAADVRDNNGVQINFSTTPTTLARLPVLFVHGHAADYQETWWNRNVLIFTLTSFKDTLGLNPELDVQPYYISFADNTRSIVDDARDIADAVDDIIRRHNTAYAAANPNLATTDPPGPPPVQVVIIGYSRGTISSRLYLKGLQEGDAGASPSRPPRPNYRPVSEFVAISPPNHGLALAPLFGDPLGALDLLPVQQLYNGVQPRGSTCGQPFVPSLGAENFIEALNGETSLDGVVDNAPNPNEAPGSRTIDQLPHQGALYVTLFDDGDMVNDHGGGECNGRGRAANLAPAAENVPVTGVQGNTSRAKHATTVHTFDVICKALYAAAHHRTPNGQTCAPHPQDSATPLIQPPAPATAMLALDLSGSMSLPACPTCATRFEVLKEAVKIFADLWLMMGRPQDRLGVTYFDTTVMPFLNNGEVLPLLTAASVNGIKTDLDLRGPSNLTAMGGALQSSIGALGAMPATGPRHVILFTDGMQNVSPMVVFEPMPPPRYEIRDDPSRPQSGLTANGTRLDMLGGIIVDTIGVGTAQSFLDLLAAISADPGPNDPVGITRATANAEDLRQFFVEALIDTLRVASPQLLAYRRGALSSSGGADETFTANRGGRQLLFKVSWPPGQLLEVRAFKNGTDVTASARVASDRFYHILAFDAPAHGSADALSGAWRLSITGPGGVAYQAAAIMDEPDLSYRVRLTEPRVRVGSPLNLVVDVNARQRPIDGRVTVTATVEQPRVAIANLIADARPPDPQGRGFEPGMTAAERQFAALSTDAERWRALTATRATTFRLARDRKSAFRGSLSRVTVPGIYRATVRISGEDRRLGRFERSESVTAIVRFGAADRRSSELALARMDTSFGLTLRPRDRYGNLLGPGLAGEIRLTDPRGRETPGPEDVGNGRYRFVVAAADVEPPFTLTVGAQPLFRGALKELRPRPRRR
jgi:von Willebrand factor type A domain